MKVASQGSSVEDVWNWHICDMPSGKNEVR